MLMFLFIFTLIYALYEKADQQIKFFLDKDIRIYVSRANHLFLVMDTITETMGTMSKYAIVSDKYSKFKLIWDPSGYKLISLGSPLCDEDGLITKCEKPVFWDIKPKNLGYTISEKGSNRCLTILDRNLVSLALCTETEDQIFDFRVAELDLGCDDDEKILDLKALDAVSKPNPIIINFNGSEVFNKAIKSSDQPLSLDHKNYLDDEEISSNDDSEIVSPKRKRSKIAEIEVIRPRKPNKASGINNNYLKCSLVNGSYDCSPDEIKESRKAKIPNYMRLQPIKKHSGTSGDTKNLFFV